MALRKSTNTLRVLPALIPNGEVIPITSGTPTTQWVIVTPDMATNWLENCNTKNRSVVDSDVKQMAADMAAGRWDGRNGEPIKFDTDGRMFEGQHRCWACVQSNTPFETLMITGCAPEAYFTSGRGRSKRYADFLGPIHGEKNVHLLSATLRLVYHWEHKGLGNGTAIRSHMLSMFDLDETYKQHPKLADSVAFIMSTRETRKLLTGSFASLIHYAGCRGDQRAMVEAFLARIGDGVGLLQDDPIWQLRDFLLSQRGPKAGIRRAGQIFVLALAIKAWNATRQGKRLQKLRFRTDETFPELV